MLIPGSFKTKITGAFGEEGRAWLETLDARVQSVGEDWQLTLGAPVTNLSYNYVLKAFDSKGTPVILKLGVPGFDFTNEITTLEVYDGKGCVRLLAADPERGALLLEQLIPGTMLTEVKDEALAMNHFIKVWRAIRRPVPEGVSCPTVLDWAKGLDRYLERYSNGEGPISKAYVQLAKDCFQDVTKTSDGPELLHGDLHHQNILFSDEQGWLAIDPKGVAGDPYFDLISYLINQLHTKSQPKERLEQRVQILVKELKLNRDRFLKAAVAMSTLYACWGVEDQDSWVNTFECARWFESFRH
ncbi:MAG TPA: aminoglycoside phosphotransferase family protein [Candidatus Angelobacter sp.]|nr:aminoglycoside phosphotransferase family protein [Candidatus Angelobacter sp.]